MEAPPSRPRLALAEMTAQNILMRANITEPPVPVRLLLETFAEVHFFDDTIERGFCLGKEVQQFVFINRLFGKDHCSFTCAHELGHLCLQHLQIDQEGITRKQIRSMRLEADCFAINALMPKSFVRSACTGGPLVQSDVHLLSLLFSVPETLMDSRLHQLGIQYDVEFRTHNRWSHCDFNKSKPSKI